MGNQSNCSSYCTIYLTVASRLNPFSLIAKYLHFFPHFSAFTIINIAGILPQCLQDHVIFCSKTEMLKNKLTSLTCAVRAMCFVEG